MPSQTSIVNQAVSLAGGRRVLSITDGTTEANLAQNYYDDCKLAVLEARAWGFATERAVLSAPGPTPAFDWPYAYTKPTGMVRLNEIYASGSRFPLDEYKLEGQSILARETSISIAYNVDAAEGLFSSSAALAVAALLASFMTYALTKNARKAEENRVLYGLALQEASSSNEAQQRSRQRQPSSRLSNLRQQ